MANAQHNHADAHKYGQGKKPGRPRRRRKLNKRRLPHNPLALGDWFPEPAGKTRLVKGFGVLDLAVKGRKLIVETLCLKVGGVVQLGLEFRQNGIILVCDRLLEHDNGTRTSPQADIGIRFVKPRAARGRIRGELLAKCFVVRHIALYAHLLHPIIGGDPRVEVSHKRHGQRQDKEPEDDIAKQRPQHAAAGNGQMLARAHRRLNQKTQERDSRQAENHLCEACLGKEREQGKRQRGQQREVRCQPVSGDEPWKHQPESISNGNACRPYRGIDHSHTSSRRTIPLPM